MADHSELLTQISGDVATLTLNRPDALNALTPDMLQALADALRDIESRRDIRAVVLTGAGRAFSAGVDLKALGGRPIVNGMVGDILDVPARAAIECMARMPQVVVGKMNGHCFTGALEIALGCDLLFAAEQAKFGDTHAKWGVRPTWGMSQRLPRRIGVARAKWLGLTARTFTAAEACEWGLVCATADAESLDALVEQNLQSIVANSADVLAAYKDLWRNTEGSTLSEGLNFEANTTYSVTDTDDRLAEFLK